MEYFRARVTRELIKLFGDDNRRIEHAMRVLYHAEKILEQKPECDSEIVIASALLHDAGIKESEEKHGYNNGKTQEQYGPPAAEKILARLKVPQAKIKIVKNIIGNHHSHSRYDYPELELLKAADRIVNRDEKV